MRVGSFAVARPAQYDRSPKSVIASVTFSVLAPHVDTQRWSYTVPAGKKSLWAGGVCAIQRVTAAGAAASVSTYNTAALSGAAAANFNGIETYSNAVGAGASVPIATGATLSAGDVVTGRTGDGSTGGTASYINNSIFTEFDA